MIDSLRTMSPLLIVTLAFSGLALVGIVLTVVLIVRTRRFLAGAVRTPGRIIDATSRVSRNRETGRRTRMFSPVFTFAGPDGREHTVTSTWSSSTPPAMGDVTVLVPRDAPERARLDRFSAIWGAGLILGLISLVLIITTGILIGVTAQG